MIYFRRMNWLQLLGVVMLVGTALVLGGCGGDTGPAAAPQGTISGITYDAATGDPTSEPTVITVGSK